MARGTEEIERLRQQVSAMVPQARLDAARDELTSSAAEVARLRQTIEGMVWKGQLERSEEEVRRLQAELVLLQRELSDLRDRVDQLLAPPPPVFGTDGGSIEGPFDLVRMPVPMLV